MWKTATSFNEKPIQGPLLPSPLSQWRVLFVAQPNDCLQGTFAAKPRPKSS